MAWEWELGLGLGLAMDSEMAMESVYRRSDRDCCCCGKPHHSRE